MPDDSACDPNPGLVVDSSSSVCGGDDLALKSIVLGERSDLGGSDWW